ncbi:hypothetical protein E2C01_005433 [Portunus trituberculatus]|uniref:Uncharacterized protein n=1 Tax=Portunus trituberculatus TaxID=210409 RepID=A0A5B7CUE1_PORTR|nr:hypothetical protein [Portunus trituberculatus]
MMDGLRGKGCVGGGNRGLVFKSVIKNRWLRNTAARAPCPGLPNPQSFATRLARQRVASHMTRPDPRSCPSCCLPIMVWPRRARPGTRVQEGEDCAPRCDFQRCSSSRRPGNAAPPRCRRTVPG